MRAGFAATALSIADLGRHASTGYQIGERQDVAGHRLPPLRD
jgi:hypothetical protein